LPEELGLRMTDSEHILGLFRDSGALLEGHFLLSSGLHSSRYLQCALVLEDPARAERLGRALAASVGVKPSVVVSPALGGLIIGHEVARALGVRHIFTERDAAGRAVLRRGFALRPGDRVVVVEDVVTTGLSTREVIAVVRAAGAEVLAVAAIIDRSGVDQSGNRAAFDVPFVSLAQLDVPAKPAESCELCAAGQPVVKPGSRTGVPACP
jgi:orotate phosphoribosyltransferase